MRGVKITQKSSNIRNGSGIERMKNARQQRNRKKNTTWTRTKHVPKQRFNVWKVNGSSKKSHNSIHIMDSSTNYTKDIETGSKEKKNTGNQCDRNVLSDLWNYTTVAQHFILSIYSTIGTENKPINLKTIEHPLWTANKEKAKKCFNNDNDYVMIMNAMKKEK